LNIRIYPTLHLDMNYLHFLVEVGSPTMYRF